jgi:hypothetical protein
MRGVYDFARALRIQDLGVFMHHGNHLTCVRYIWRRARYECLMLEDLCCGLHLGFVCEHDAPKLCHRQEIFDYLGTTSHLFDEWPEMTISCFQLAVAPRTWRPILPKKTQSTHALGCPIVQKLKTHQHCPAVREHVAL